MDTNKLVEQISEAEALELHYQFARKFGWAGVLYVREDASDLWHDDDLALTDEQWEAIKATNAWSRMGEYLSSDAYDYARQAIREAKAKCGEYTVWVGGTEANDYLLTQENAVAMARHYLDEGYDDVKIVNTATNIVLMHYEWSK